MKKKRVILHNLFWHYSLRCLLLDHTTSLSLGNFIISVELFIFCVLFRIKNHLAELRLVKFYDHFSHSLTERGKSWEQITDELYLCLSHMLCLSIIHFYAFLVIFFIYLFMDQCFNNVYLNHQLIKKPEWGKNKFEPTRLFKSWIYMTYLEFIMLLIILNLLFIFPIKFALLASVFIFTLFFIEIIMDWFFINDDFYLNYYSEES